jgi:rod shape-determining protein MreC
MSLLNIIFGPQRRLLGYLERRRGLAVVIAAAVILALGTTSAVVSRPPLITPLVDGVTAGFLAVSSQPLRMARYLLGPRGGSSRVMQLELEIASLRRAERENKRLRAMLGYEPPAGYQTVPGRVMGLDLDPLRGVAWINVGSAAGLRGGEAVLTVDGLVGVVDEVKKGRSRVRLLRNEFTPVSVRNTRSRRLGIVEWDPGQGRLRVSQVPFQADIAKGDTMISSGLGGVFPPDLLVGTVAAVRDPPERLLKEVVLQPFGAFFRLEEVFVIVPLEGPVFHPPAPIDTAAIPVGEGSG